MDTRQRLLASALAVCVALGSQLAFGQPRKVYRIGYLALEADQKNPVFQAFVGRMRELGWNPGETAAHNPQFIYRASRGVDARFAEYAAEVVREKVDVIVTNNTAGTRAAMAATPTIPVVFGSVANPDKQKIIASYRRPGGNVTGLALLVPELNVKRLELLKEALPRATRIGLMYQADSIVPMQSAIIKEDDEAARMLGLTLELIPVTSIEDFDRAFETAVKAKVDAIRVTNGAIFAANRAVFSRKAIEHRLPLMGADSRMADAGALMSHGENYPDRYRKAAELVDKVLKGANPAELPVEYPDTVELVVNLRTAKLLGVSVPASVLSQARRVVE